MNKVSILSIFFCTVFAGVSNGGQQSFTLVPVDLYDRVDASYHGRVLDRVEISAWRNERVHVQFAVSCVKDVKMLKITIGDLRTAEGHVISSHAGTCRFVQAVKAKMPEGIRAVPDLLNPVSTCDFSAGDTAGVWVTVAVPRTAMPGLYTGAVTASSMDGATVTVPIRLRILNRPPLPDPKDRKFFLDLWQHPWSVAAYYNVKPFSKEHYEKLAPLYHELAAGGQKVILTTIVDLPWGENYSEKRDEIRGMVDYVKDVDGQFHADFRIFDEYVAFAKACGMGPQIHCYTIVKFNDKHIFYYMDKATGERRAEELYEGTEAYEEFLTPLLTQLEAHLIEKGWIDDAYIAIDEVAPERLLKPRTFLKRVAPKLKFAAASNQDPLRYRPIDADLDVMSQLVWTGFDIKSIDTPEFDAFVSARRDAGRITTFYVCVEPQHPNSWFSSPLIETEWIGLYAAAKGFDGFLRWAAFLWPPNPFDSTSSPVSYPAGENTLIYPGGLASIRWEILRDSIEDWEKIRLLRDSGSISPQLKAALGAYSFTAMERADEADYRDAVDAVLKELNREVNDAADDPKVAAWEGGLRVQTLDWFRGEFFGRAPGRPVDEKFTEEGVECAGGEIRIKIHVTLPEGASAEHPVPVFILGDHYYGAERADGLWTRPHTPTNMITSRGYAYVNVNFNDVALNCYDERWSNLVHRIYGVGKPDDWGTISAWAWCLSRVVDWIETRPELDAKRIAVTGHSRGGKAALWAAAQDRRIALAAPNGSGTGGARLMCMRDPEAEPLKWMLTNSIRFWFCPNAQKYRDCERHLPYDADDLIRLVAPRLVYVGSGSADLWAGPEGEFEAARRASDLWRAYGKTGLGIDLFPKPGEWSHEGSIGYHLHDGPHQLEPWDWERFLDFADGHLKKKGE